jgi:hypothetical protein
VGTLVRQLSEQAAAHVCTWETVDGLNFRCISFVMNVSFNFHSRPDKPWTKQQGSLKKYIDDKRLISE